MEVHDLRHACATRLLASGVDIAVVRDILGHSTIALTANTYAAVLPSLQSEAVERLATYIGFEVRLPERGRAPSQEARLDVIKLVQAAKDASGPPSAGGSGGARLGQRVVLAKGSVWV